MDVNSVNNVDDNSEADNLQFIFTATASEDSAIAGKVTGINAARAREMPPQPPISKQEFFEMQVRSLLGVFVQQDREEQINLQRGLSETLVRLPQQDQQAVRDLVQFKAQAAGIL